MTYTCKDCSYRGTKSSSDGSCLACGSFNLSRGDAEPEKPESSRLRVGLLVGLWVYLIGLILWKLSH
jgi:hypothetical protein